MISAIVAVDNNWGIGFNGDLLEHIPEDLKHFKRLTTESMVVMGRKTWDSLPRKPLPNRLNMVITNQPRHYEEMTVFTNLDEIKIRMKYADVNDKWFVIGGGIIYKELLPLCEKVYVTKIYKEHDNIDTYFPDLDLSNEWKGTSSSEIKEYDGVKYQFWLYERT